jgi:hypothetical protein
MFVHFACCHKLFPHFLQGTHVIVATFGDGLYAGSNTSQKCVMFVVVPVVEMLLPVAMPLSVVPVVLDAFIYPSLNPSS